MTDTSRAARIRHHPPRLLTTVVAVLDWFEDKVVVPTETMIRRLEVGDSTVEPDDCDVFGFGVEGLFRTEATRQYESWPEGSTTDGTRVYFVARVGADSVEVVGLTHLDFGEFVFPSRAAISSNPRGVHVVGFIGQTDERTGAPPRFPPGTLISTPRNDHGRCDSPTLLVGHGELQPVWTQAFEITR